MGSSLNYAWHLVHTLQGLAFFIMGLKHLKLKCWQDWSKEDSVSLLSQLSEATPSPWLLAPFLHLQSQQHHAAISLVLTLLSPLSIYPDLCDYSGATQIIHNNPPILRSAD